VKTHRGILSQAQQDMQQEECLFVVQKLFLQFLTTLINDRDILAFIDLYLKGNICNVQISFYKYAYQLELSQVKLESKT
jgi:hypothetical protein